MIPSGSNELSAAIDLLHSAERREMPGDTSQLAALVVQSQLEEGLKQVEAPLREELARLRIHVWTLTAVATAISNAAMRLMATAGDQPLRPEVYGQIQRLTTAFEKGLLRESELGDLRAAMKSVETKIDTQLAFTLEREMSRATMQLAKEITGIDPTI